MANFFSFVILVFLLIGRRLARRSPRLHGQWMTGVISADLILIGYLVIARKALGKLSGDMPVLLMIHLSFAVTTVILYLLALWIGWRLLQGHSHPGAMRRLDRVITPTRILTLATSLALAWLASDHD